MKNSYLWIGNCASDELKEDILKNNGKLLSGFISQTNLFEGIEKSENIVFDSINAIRVVIYPYYKQRHIPEYRWSHKDGAEDVSVAYNNTKYINHISRRNAMEKEAKKWAKKHKDDNVTVIVYSMHTPFMAAAAKVKSIIPTAKIILIVPDLPQFMKLNPSLKRKFLKFVDWQKIKRFMKSIDRYVLYSKHMATFLGLKDGTWEVMEGSFNESDLVNETPLKDDTVIPVMYSGLLDVNYGIPDLLEGFSLIKDERYRLWFTGIGDAKSLIKEYAEKDSRIELFGYLPTRKDLLLKQKQAAMLINVRSPLEKASAYCFPSKIFEYMLSGNPVLSYRIPGIPDEYFNYLVEIPEVSPQSIADTILKIGSLSVEEREKLGYRSKQFVVDNKNNISQAKKILG